MMFSVIIPVFNRSETLQRALKSVLLQTYQKFEILVIDDGSTSPFAKQIHSIVESLSDPRIQLLVHPQNVNGAAARNTGIRQARGKYVCFLDSDDEWEAEKLFRVKEAVEPNNDNAKALLIHHQYVNVDSGRRGSPLPEQAMQPGESVAHYSFVTNNGGGIQSSTICVDTQLAAKVLFNEKLRGHQDWDFCLRAGAAECQFVFIPEVLTLRHRDTDNGVVKSLDWNYSLSFYYAYQRYFDPLSAAFFFNRVVLKKALHSNNVHQALLSRLFFYSLIVQPQLLFSNLYGHYRQRWHLRHRVARMFRICRRKQVKDLVIWGRNGYGKAIINSRPKHLNINLVLDAVASETLDSFMNIRMQSIRSVKISRLQSCDAIVLATDRHQEAMCEELARVDKELLKKIIRF